MTRQELHLSIRVEIAKSQHCEWDVKDSIAHCDGMGMDMVQAGQILPPDLGDSRMQLKNSCGMNAALITAILRILIP